MKIDLRILFIVTLFLLIAASAVAIAKNLAMARATAVPYEVIQSKAVPTAGRVTPGLELRVNAEGLSLILPNCDATEWQEKFFVHLYTDSVRNKSPDNFTGMDFNLKEEVSKISKNENRTSCLVFKSFSNFKVRAVGVGQFSAPNGKCCDIIWSRFYNLDSSFEKK